MSVLESQEVCHEVHTAHVSEGRVGHVEHLLQRLYFLFAVDGQQLLPGRLTQLLGLDPRAGTRIETVHQAITVAIQSGAVPGPTGTLLCVVFGNHFDFEAHFANVGICNEDAQRYGDVRQARLDHEGRDRSAALPERVLVKGMLVGAIPVEILHNGERHRRAGIQLELFELQLVVRLIAAICIPAFCAASCKIRAEFY